MRRVSISLLLFALIATLACGRQSEPSSSFRFEDQIGIAHLSHDGRDDCVAIANASIPPDTTALLADQGAENLALATSRTAEAIIGERVADCDKSHLYSSEWSPSGPAYYRIRLMDEWKGNGYAVLIVPPSGTIAVGRDQKIEGDLDGDGIAESFRVCTSSEGAHYQVWTGEPLSGQPRWHWYVYAGYDTGVTCTENDYFGPKEQ